MDRVPSQTFQQDPPLNNGRSKSIEVQHTRKILEILIRERENKKDDINVCSTCEVLYT